MEKNKSNIVKSLLVGIGILVVILVVLEVGISIGYHKAKFAGEFGRSFERNFIGERGGKKMIFFNEKLPGGHGAVGKIVSFNLPRLVISGPDNLEKTILVGTSTLVRRFQEEIETQDLKTGEFIVVLGNPNESGEIEAKLIRVMPDPEAGFINKADVIYEINQ